MHCVMLIDCVSSTPSYVCQLCEFCTALCVPVVRVSDCVIRVGCATSALPYAYRLCEFWIALCSSRESNSSGNSDRWRHRTPLALWGLRRTTDCVLVNFGVITICMHWLHHLVV